MHSSLVSASCSWKKSAAEFEHPMTLYSDLSEELGAKFSGGSVPLLVGTVGQPLLVPLSPPVPTPRTSSITDTGLDNTTLPTPSALKLNATSIVVGARSSGSADASFVISQGQLHTSNSTSPAVVTNSTSLAVVTETIVVATVVATIYPADVSNLPATAPSPSFIMNVTASPSSTVQAPLMTTFSASSQTGSTASLEISSVASEVFSITSYSESPTSSSTAAASTSRNSSSGPGFIAGVTLGTAVAVSVLVAAVIWLIRRRTRMNSLDNLSDFDYGRHDMFSPNPLRLAFSSGSIDEPKLYGGLVGALPTSRSDMGVRSTSSLLDDRFPSLPHPAVNLPPIAFDPRDQRFGRLGTLRITNLVPGDISESESVNNAGIGSGARTATNSIASVSTFSLNSEMSAGVNGESTALLQPQFPVLPRNGTTRNSQRVASMPNPFLNPIGSFRKDSIFRPLPAVSSAFSINTATCHPSRSLKLQIPPHDTAEVATPVSKATPISVTWASSVRTNLYQAITTLQETLNTALSGNPSTVDSVSPTLTTFPTRSSTKRSVVSKLSRAGRGSLLLPQRQIISEVFASERIRGYDGTDAVSIGFSPSSGNAGNVGRLGSLVSSPSAPLYTPVPPQVLSQVQLSRGSSFSRSISRLSAPSSLELERQSLLGYSVEPSFSTLTPTTNPISTEAEVTTLPHAPATATLTRSLANEASFDRCDSALSSSSSSSEKESARSRGGSRSPSRLPVRRVEQSPSHRNRRLNQQREYSSDSNLSSPISTLPLRIKKVGSSKVFGAAAYPREVLGR